MLCARQWRRSVRTQLAKQRKAIADAELGKLPVPPSSVQGSHIEGYSVMNLLLDDIVASWKL
eukprot:1107286-Amphidinium_carterae.1